MASIYSGVILLVILIKKYVSFNDEDFKNIEYFFLSIGKDPTFKIFSFI